MNIRNLQTGICHRLATRLNSLFNKIAHKLFKLCAGDLDVHMLGTGLVGRQERQVDFGFHH